MKTNTFFKKRIKTDVTTDNRYRIHNFNSTLDTAARIEFDERLIEEELQHNIVDSQTNLNKTFSVERITNAKSFLNFVKIAALQINQGPGPMSAKSVAETEIFKSPPCAISRKTMLSMIVMGPLLPMVSEMFGKTSRYEDYLRSFPLEKKYQESLNYAIEGLQSFLDAEKLEIGSLNLIKLIKATAQITRAIEDTLNKNQAAVPHSEKIIDEVKKLFTENSLNINEDRTHLDIGQRFKLGNFSDKNLQERFSSIKLVEENNSVSENLEETYTTEAKTSTREK